MPTTYIKLDRNLMNWRWFRNQNTLQLWIYILMKANITEHDFEKITVHRGELVTSYESLSAATGLTVNKVRTALEHLKNTGEITVKSHPKFSVISVLNYDLYQGEPQANNTGYTSKSQSYRRQITDKSQQYNNEIMKERKNEKNERMEKVCAQTHAHGKLNNVFLSSSEYEKFRSDHPYICDEIIDELSYKIAAEPYRYKNGHIGHLYIFARNYTPKMKCEHKEASYSPASYDIQQAMERCCTLTRIKLSVTLSKYRPTLSKHSLIHRKHLFDKHC